ncbi:MAG TPA: hypothetical protein VF584_26760 [Longimicrobium sp.]|jgi:hypothetical protein
MSRGPNPVRVSPSADLDLLAPLQCAGAGDTSEPVNVPRGKRTTTRAAPPATAADETVAATPLPPRSDSGTVVAVLTARMEVLLRHTYRYAPPVMEIEATRASFLPYEPGRDWREARAHEHAVREQNVACGWLPHPPAAEDEPGWRGWCAMIEEYAHLATALLPPDHPEARRFVARVDPRPACVPPLESWLLAAGRERITALHHELRRRYHAHPWFTRDRDTPAPLLRVRGRLAKRREMGDKRPWNLASDAMAELEAILVRCAPRWWYHVVVERGATPLADLKRALDEWRVDIDIPPDAALYATADRPAGATLTT